MSIPTSVLQELARSRNNLRASAYTCGAGMTVMLYDWILTFPDEVKYIWNGQQKMSVVKAMFFWNRYFVVPWIILANYHIAGLRGPVSNKALVRLSSNHRIVMFTGKSLSCKIIIPTVAIIQGISIIIGIQLLALRVLALYKNNRKIRIGLFCYLAACHITLLAMTGVTMSRFVPILMYLPATNTCYTIPDPLIKSVYIPPLLAEGGIVILQIINHIHRRRQQNLLKSPLVSTLFRDGYLYFALVLSIRLLCLFVYEFADPSLWFIANQMDFPISTALITRFFLQLRGAVTTDEETVIPRTSAASHPHPTKMIDHNRSHLHSGQNQESPNNQWYRDSRTVMDSQDGPVPLKELRRLKSGRITPSYTYSR